MSSITEERTRASVRYHPFRYTLKINITGHTVAQGGIFTGNTYAKRRKIDHINTEKYS